MITECQWKLILTSRLGPFEQTGRTYLCCKQHRHRPHTSSRVHYNYCQILVVSTRRTGNEMELFLKQLPRSETYHRNCRRVVPREVTWLKRDDAGIDKL